VPGPVRVRISFSAAVVMKSLRRIIILDDDNDPANASQRQLTEDFPLFFVL
jgi:hypothetical protein